MYRSTWEADRARIVALEQELADAQAALAARDAGKAGEPRPAEAIAEANHGPRLLLIFSVLVALNIVSCLVRSSQTASDSDEEESVPMQVLRDL